MIGLIFNWPNFIVLALGLIAFKVCNDKYKETKSRALLNCIPGILHPYLRNQLLRKNFPSFS